MLLNGCLTLQFEGIFIIYITMQKLSNVEPVLKQFTWMHLDSKQCYDFVIDVRKTSKLAILHYSKFVIQILRNAQNAIIDFKEKEHLIWWLNFCSVSLQ